MTVRDARPTRMLPQYLVSDDVNEVPFGPPSISRSVRLSASRPGRRTRFARQAEASVERFAAALKWTSNDDKIVPQWRPTMRTTIALDDELVAKAQSFTGLTEKSSLVREALKALIERESARRLARLGGSEGKLRAPPRRRSRPA
jgi:Arc/MetJ family transcription regulator